MSEMHPVIQIPESTVDVLSILEVGGAIDLVSRGDFSHGLCGMHSEVSVFDGGSESGDLQANTTISVHPPEIHPGDVSRFRQALEPSGMFIVDTSSVDDTNVTVFYQYIPGFDEHISGLALPVYSNAWHVKTVGPGFWKHEHDQRKLWTESVMTFHASVVNAVLRATSHTHEQGAENGQSEPMQRVILLMPGGDSGQNEGLSIDGEPEWGKDILPPEYYFSNFVGIGAVVRELCDVVEIANATEEEVQEFGLELSQAILLIGPSGVGKTGLAGGFAEALGAEEVINVNFSDVSGAYVGEWGRNLDEIFTEAYKKSTNGRVVIFMDELDGLANTGNQVVTQNVTTVFKKQLEEIRKHPNVFFIAATNEPDLIDPVIRADKRMTKITVPNLSESGRQELLRKLIFPDPSGTESSTAPAVAETLIEAGDLEAELSAAETRGFDLLAALPELSGQLADFSPGDIREVVAQVRRNLFLEAKKAGLEPRDPSRQDFLAAIDKAKKNRA